MTATARAVGVSYRRLDYWSRCGYLRPQRNGAGSGTWRRWTEHELDVARLMTRLVDAGVTVPVAARVARAAVLNGGGDFPLAPGIGLRVNA